MRNYLFGTAPSFCMLNQYAINEFQACSLDKIIISVEKKLWPRASNALPNEPEVKETVHAMTATASVQIRTGNETTK